jgi:hypothetical protein
MGNQSLFIKWYVFESICQYYVYNARTNEHQENDDTLQKQWIDRTEVSDECLRYRDSMYIIYTNHSAKAKRLLYA